MAKYEGDIYQIDIIHVVQERLSQDLVKAKLSEEDYNACKSVSEFDQIKSSRKDGSKPAWTPPNLSNYTIEGLIDAVGKSSEEEKQAKKAKEFYKEALKVRLANQQSEEQPP